MSLFERLRDTTSVNILGRYGEPFVITTEPSIVFNPATGGTTSSTQSQTLLGKAFSRDASLDPSEMVETTEVEIYVTASDAVFTPSPGGTVRESAKPTEVFRISRVQKIPESGTVVIYRLLARK